MFKFVMATSICFIIEFFLKSNIEKLFFFRFDKINKFFNPE